MEIEAGHFGVAFNDRGLQIVYGETTLPIDPRAYGHVLASALESFREESGADDADVIELQSILTAIKHLPPRSAADHAGEACAECRVIKRRLAELAGRSSEFVARVQTAVTQINGVPGDPPSFARLEELLDLQAYRPCFRRVASDEINYRRFFDVNDLAALSTEREEVFAAVHRKVFAWVGDGSLDGLRIDHPDGLFDPKLYLDRLQLYTRLAAARSLLDQHPSKYGDLTWQAAEGSLRERFAAVSARPMYVTVEKILGTGEDLPPNWATDGTTGYEFINAVNGLFVNQANESAMSRLYTESTGFTEPFDELVFTSKFHLLQSSLASELHMLAHQLDRIAQAARWSRDFTLNGLRHALREVIACFPVYRSYINHEVHESDRLMILRAVARARARNPLQGRLIFDFIRDTLLLKDPISGPATPEYKAAQRRFAGKFQQVTAPTMAKGLEDTAFYVHARLISLNEVGGDPTRFGRSVSDLHRFFEGRADHYPDAMSPLSTHDTKRSEDVRARINVLSEMPHAWLAHVSGWMELNRPHKIDIGEGQLAPDTNEEYFLYQTLIGAWPIGGLGDRRAEFVERIQAYMNKALHEAKVHTSWMNPNAEYDAAAKEFVSRILDPERAGAFLMGFESFQRTVSRLGMFNSLSQTLLRATAPGVPDTYQGTEFWDFSLVDPDNRRPVDYEYRARALADLDADADRNQLALARELVREIDDGRIKLYILSRSQRFRRDHSRLMKSGAYVPMEVVGSQSGHAFCFLRAHEGEAALVVVPRLLAGLGLRGHGPSGIEVWRDAAGIVPNDLRRASWRNVFTGESVELADDGSLLLGDVLANFPVALLITKS
jgi:(1->4)-alpha-D-glucan 1-alpha-D-glucosylmutase